MARRQASRTRRRRRKLGQSITPKSLALAIGRVLNNMQSRPSGVDSTAIVAALKESIASLGSNTVTALQEGMMRRIDTMAQKVATEREGKHVAYVSCDQRHTKNLGNYESFVYGFSISFPVPVEVGDDIEMIETKEKLRPKYEAAANLISDIMKEVGMEIDKARGVA